MGFYFLLFFPIPAFASAPLPSAKHFNSKAAKSGQFFNIPAENERHYQQNGAVMKLGQAI